MIGSIRWNLIAGLIGFAGTFFSSFTKNVMSTALIQSLYSACFLFILCFAFRFVLGFLAKAAGLPASAGTGETEPKSQQQLGRTIDFTTPPSEEVAEAIAKPQDEPEARGDGTLEGNDFKPLDPPKFVSKLDEQQMAEAVRKLSEE